MIHAYANTEIGHARDAHYIIIEGHAEEHLAARNEYSLICATVSAWRILFEEYLISLKKKKPETSYHIESRDGYFFALFRTEEKINYAPLILSSFVTCLKTLSKDYPDHLSFWTTQAEFNAAATSAQSEG